MHAILLPLLLLNFSALPAQTGHGPTTDPQEKRAATLNQQGAQAAQDSDYRGAAEAFAAAVKLEPNNEQYLANLAAARMWLKAIPQAIMALRGAAKIAASNDAYDRVIQYQQQIWRVMYTQPAWANEKRLAAAKLPETPGVQDAVKRYQALYQKAQNLLGQGKLDEALPQAQEAVQIALEHLGAEHSFTTVAQNLQGDIFRMSGNFAEARLAYEHAVRGAITSLGAGHPDTLVYMNNLGATDEAEGALRSAERNYRRVYNTARKVLGENSFVTLTYINNLGLLLHKRGQSKKAITILDAVYRRKVKLLGPEHFDTLAVLLNLARVLGATGKKKSTLQLMARGYALSAATLGEKHPLHIAFREELAQRTDLNDPVNVFTIIRQQLGAKAPLTIAAMGGAGHALAVRGKFDAAEKLLLRVLEYERLQHGERHEKTWMALNALADFNAIAGRYPKAEKLFNTAFTQMRDVLGVEHADTLRVAGNLSLIKEKRADYDAANTIALRVLETAQKTLGPQRPDTLSYMNNLALIAGARGESKYSAELYAKVLKARTTLLGASHQDTLQSTHNLAMAYHRLGRFEAARALERTALQGRKTTLGENHPDTLRSLSALGTLSMPLGDYAEAQGYYENALERQRQVLGENHPETLDTMGDLAALLITQERLDKAKDLLVVLIERRKNILGPLHPSTLSSINNLAIVHQRQLHVQRAEKIFLKLLKAYKAAGFEHHPTILAPINNLATIYSDMQQPSKSIPLYLRAIALSTELLSPEHTDTLTFKENLAVDYDTLGQRKKALALHTSVLASRRRLLGNSHPHTLTSLTNLAIHHEAQGHMDEAAVLWHESLRQTSVFLDRILWSADSATREAYINDLGYLRSRLLSFLVQRGGHEAATEALNFALLRKGLLLKIAAESTALMKASKDPQVAADVAALNASRRVLAQSALRNVVGSNDNAAKRAREMELLQEKIEKLERKIGRSLSRVARTHTQVSPADVASRLSSSQVLIEYLNFTRTDLRTGRPIDLALAAVVVHKDQPPTLIDLGNFRNISENIETFRKLLQSPDNLQETTAVSYKLYTKLFYPLKDAIGSATDLLVIPDGTLHLIPFAALRNSPDAKGKYLVQTHRIVQMSSSRDLVLPPPAGGAKPGVIFSAPDYKIGEPNTPSTTRGKQLSDLYFAPLPGAAIEGKLLNTLMRQHHIPVQHYFGGEATEQRLSRLVSSPRFLHLATHGFFLDAETAQNQARTRGLFLGRRNENGVLYAHPTKASSSYRDNSKGFGNLLRSGLAFSGANKGLQGARLAGDTDGVLTAYEALALDLRGTELVVLSACDTGLGGVKRGEGVYGLRRAFQEAGAQAVLSTLWSIDDNITQTFMQRFYTAVLAGDRPATALRRVQIGLFSQDGPDRLDTRYGHPYYWAPFVLVGPP